MATDTNMLYEDAECTYEGGDPRLAAKTTGTVELYADQIRFIDKDAEVLVWPLRSIRHASFQPGRHYSSEEIMEAKREARRASEAQGYELAYFSMDDVPPGLLLVVNDPEGVMPDGFPVHLGCRDDYWAKVLAKRIRQAARLAPSGDELPLNDILTQGEGPRVEFKERLTTKCATTIAAFANGYGGTLLTGVADDGSVVGLAMDNYFYCATLLALIDASICSRRL